MRLMLWWLFILNVFKWLLEKIKSRLTFNVSKVDIRVMKVKSQKKREINRKSKKGLKGRKKSKSIEKKPSVNLIASKSNGTSNWDQLAKILGYDTKKAKTSVMTGESNLQSSKDPKMKHIPGQMMNGHVVSYKDALCGKKTNVLIDRNSSAPARTVSYASALSGKRDITDSKKVYTKVVSPKKSSSSLSAKVDLQNTDDSVENKQNRSSSPRLTRYVAMDCEMVGTGKDGKDSMIARVSIVNRYGDCLYDTYVKPMEEITDFRTFVSGVRPAHLKDGKDLYSVQKDVLKILQGRMLVGHALKNDMDVLFISHPKSMMRDTSSYKPFRQLCDGRTPSLKKLAEKLLGADIQKGEHSSIEDAQAAMQIFLMHKLEWEKEMKRKNKRHSTRKMIVTESTEVEES